MTLELDQPQKVGENTLTFVGFAKKQHPRDKDAMVVQVDTPDGDRFYSYPKLFRNNRTGQTMANPHVKSALLEDFYVSPLEYSPGRPAGSPMTVELAEGEEAHLGDYTVRFNGFDMDVDGNAFAKMSEGVGQVTLGAKVDLVDAQNGSRPVMALYKFDQASRQVETPPAALPGGGMVRIAAINANSGTVRLAFAGLPGLTAGEPPTLSVDVTKKPLIQLVWFGLYVILMGGILSMVKRVRQSLRPDPLRQTASAPGDEKPA